MEKRVSFLLIALIVGFSFAASALLFTESLENIALLDRETIVLPVKAHIVMDESKEFESERTRENALLLFSGANRLWEKAHIFFEVESVSEIYLEKEAIEKMLEKEELTPIVENEAFGKGKVNVFFLKQISGPSGRAITREKIALVSDKPRFNDFRVLAHELGHLLGLPHLKDTSMLMGENCNGEALSKKEIVTVRRNAQALAQNK